MHFPVLIHDLAVILGVAAIVTFVFRRIKQPVVLGYIVAGIIVGPFTPAVFSVTDTESIKVWAELGVIFLMFTLGLEFSFRRLARVGMSAAVTAIIQVITMLALGIGAAALLGWSRMDAVFLGCMISISSTTIIIKALEELGLKTKKFADLVFGILIVEDLVAILMLVALTNIATKSHIGGVELLMAAGKLAIVVGAWFLVGIFLVPRFIRAVSKHGNDEMLTVVAIGLCLALVALAAYFHYSLALGAFIMGSILAESSEAKRIEHLVQPLKDIFGAVFFVSVGMLLDPTTIVQNVGAIVLISAVIVLGKLLAVIFGTLATGQTIKTAVQTGFSMAQIGEFSFIIASLGLVYGVISEKLYPVIVAASLLTTFTTPYLIKAAGRVAEYFEANLPDRARAALNSYTAWLQQRDVPSARRQELFRNLGMWGGNAIVVVTVFTLGAEKLTPVLEGHFEDDFTARFFAWLTAFFLASPSIWAMLTAFRSRQPASEPKRTYPRSGSLLTSQVLTVTLVGLLSSEYFSAVVTMTITFVVCGAIFLVFRHQIGAYYQWIERQFHSGFQADQGAPHGQSPHDRLAPWDAHLVEVKVPPQSFVIGQSLNKLSLREKYGLNVVVIIRGSLNIVAPKASIMLFPNDRILCFATDSEIERFKDDIEARDESSIQQKDIDAYELKRLTIEEGSSLVGVTIKDSGIQEKFDCIVVGLERHEQRIKSPDSKTLLTLNDRLWIIGETHNLQKLRVIFH